MKRLRNATTNMFTLNKETEAILNRLVEAKLAKTKSALVRDAIHFYEIKAQIEILLANFVYTTDMENCKAFFIEIKELMTHV
jgi:predicted DNA-binding protein